MNRRSFLSEFIKGTVILAAAPTIVTHGLHLRQQLIEPVRLWPGYFDLATDEDLPEIEYKPTKISYVSLY